MDNSYLSKPEISYYMHLPEAILKTRKTGKRVTIYLLVHLPDEVWKRRVPGYQQKTVRMIGGHLHNTRSM
ncbi:MAG: hypothetical protein R3281_00625 [Balneolaceae bacterium]|nr:hypothetical protein [Balneolaceae bacterium]